MLDARPVRGRFRRLRTRVDAVLVAILLATPWLRLPDGQPLVLLDIPARRFHVLGLTIFPEELYFLWLLLAALALALFFFTALAGRLWCGWACPQTVLSDLFAGVARRIEGWHGHRSRPAHVAGWRRALRHVAWVAMSVVIGFHLVAYFHSPYAFLAELRSGAPPTTALGFALAASALAWLDLAIVRQTFCKYLCPYARFQSVLFDRDTLVVGYDAARGEPRGKRRRSAAGEPRGDCVDCRLCVEVCPTGIDIRDGLQLECIACTQCIDACDGVMEKIGRPPGLIAYRALSTLEEGRPPRLLRPRVVAYAALLSAVIVAFVGLLLVRQPMGLEVLRNRASLASLSADGRIANAFTLHVQNRARSPRRFEILLEAPPGFELVTGMNPLPVDAESTARANVFVLADPQAPVGPAGLELRFVLRPVDAPEQRIERGARFLTTGAHHAQSRDTTREGERT